VQKKKFSHKRPGISNNHWQIVLLVILVTAILLGCAAFQLPARLLTPTLAPTSTLLLSPTLPPTEAPASPVPTATAEIDTPEPTLPPELNITEYAAPDASVTIDIPEGGRFVIVGDSLSYGSQFLGKTTYQDICDNRWPYAQQLAVETGIMTTANLDRGDSMKTPFYSRVYKGKAESFCLPGPDVPLLDTVVPGSNTTEWIEDLRFYPVFVQELEKPENPVVLFLMGADVFAEKIGKPPETADDYEQNVGQLITYISSFDKIIYLAHIPHTRVGSFISKGELAATNAQIDLFNQRLDEMIARNGFTDVVSGNWVDFGEQVLEQDGIRFWVNRLQAGPALDQLSATFPDNIYAKDGLHYHAEAYDQIGIAWANSLKAPIPVVKAEQLP